MGRDGNEIWNGFNSGQWYSGDRNQKSDESVPRRKALPSKESLLKSLGIGEDGRLLSPTGSKASPSVLPSDLQPKKSASAFRIQSVWMFGGSGLGNDPSLWGEAMQLAEILARRQVCLYYNGAADGMIGMVAEQFLRLGGSAVVVTPKATADVACKQVETLVVERSNQRRELMLRKPDCYCALPGGVGTFRDIIEVWLWGQMGLHKKPCGVLNSAGFYDGFQMLIDRMVSEGFLSDNRRGRLLMASNANELVDTLEDYCPVRAGHDDATSIQHSIG